MFGPLESAARPLLRAISRVERGRSYHRVLRRGAVDRRTAHKVRLSSWWGDDPRWYAGGTPPRLHNRVTPLIDGDSYFAALRQALDGARSYVYVAGWCLTPYFPIGRES